MRLRSICCRALIVLGLSTSIGSAQAVVETSFSPSHSTSKVDNEAELVSRSTLIILGTPSGVPSMSPIQGNVLPEGQLVHYQQEIKVEKVLKGSAPSKIHLSRLGIEPLPPVEDPINQVYPGPLAEDVHYILFLEKEPAQNLYHVIGIWQGVYPLDYQGKTISLYGSGFSSLEGLTVSGLQERITHLTR